MRGRVPAKGLGPRDASRRTVRGQPLVGQQTRDRLRDVGRLIGIDEQPRAAEDFG